MTITASDLGFRLEMLRVRGGGRLGVNWVRWGEQQEGTPPHREICYFVSREKWFYASFYKIFLNLFDQNLFWLL